MPKYTPIDNGFKYLTFPDYDVEKQTKELGDWVRKIQIGDDPVKEKYDKK